MIPRQTRWALAVIVGAYAGIVALALLAEASGSWAVRFATLPLIAALQNHLQILQHDGAHGLLHPRRPWNDALADVCCSLPFGGWLRHYRYFHLQHHAYVTDPERDPEIEFYREQGYEFQPLSWQRELWLSFLDFCGYHSAQFFVSYNLYLWRTQTPALRLRPRDHAASAIALAAGAIVAWRVGFGNLMFYWFLPANTWLFFFMKWSAIHDHRARTGGPLEEFTDDREIGVLARFFLSPLSTHYHRTHHQNPRLPWYELKSKSYLTWARESPRAP